MLKVVISVIILLTIAAIAAQLIINNLSIEEPVALIYENNILIREVYISNKESEGIIIPLSGNTVEVRGGKIGITKATCPDKLCVEMGFIDGLMPIICLPNRVEIRIETANHNKNTPVVDGIVW